MSSLYSKTEIPVPNGNRAHESPECRLGCFATELWETRLASEFILVGDPQHARYKLRQQNTKYHFEELGKVFLVT